MGSLLTGRPYWGDQGVPRRRSRTVVGDRLGAVGAARPARGKTTAVLGVSGGVGGADAQIAHTVRAQVIDLDRARTAHAGSSGRTTASRTVNDHDRRGQRECDREAPTRRSPTPSAPR
ncbi:hypothetical protein ABZ922_03520 [Streptomyces shenzhenensis]|uniref:hypothetical protein n=1 Tax=Streptomyces shenzhenensis TaxID=943815 RepID=UPI003404F43F